MVLLIQTSCTWAQNLNILTEFILNEAHKLFDPINVFRGKHSAMNPTPIHLIKNCRKTHKSMTAPIQIYIFNKVKKNIYLSLAAMSLDALSALDASMD